MAAGNQSAFGYRYQYLVTIERTLRFMRDHLGDLPAITTANPARRIKLPHKRKREHHYLTDEQVFELARQAGPDKGVIIGVLAYCGLRWGELAGLHSLTSTCCAAASTCAATPLPSADR